MALYGRHAEAPLPVVAAYSPSHCFEAAIEAARIALKYRTPVILLSDGYIANGAEPWRLPDVDDAARHLRALRHRAQPRARRRHHGVLALPARSRDAGPPVGHPGHARAQHRVGGLEKEDGTGNISYEPENHEQHGPPAGRQGRRHRQRHPARRRCEGDEDAELLVARLGLHLGGHRRRCGAAWRRGARRWPGSTSCTSTRSRPTWATSCAATRSPRARDQPRPALPAVRAEYLVDAKSITKVQGVPFTALRARTAYADVLGGTDGRPHDRHRRPPRPRKKDWTSDQEVRWCPGCGDYGILPAVQMLMPELGVQARARRVRVRASAAPAASRTT